MGTAATTPARYNECPFAKLFDRLSVRARVAASASCRSSAFSPMASPTWRATSRVGRAFDSVRRDNAVVEASSDLKSGLLAMRLATVIFATHPTDGEVKAFDQAQQLAMKSLDRIEASLVSSQQDVITPLRITIRDLKASFDSLVECRARARLQRKGGHDRRPDRRQRRDRAHHQQRTDLGRRSRFGGKLIDLAARPCGATKSNTG